MNIGPQRAQPDPLLDEVRAVRKAISDAHGNDVNRLCDYLQNLEREAGHRLVRLPAGGVQQDLTQPA